MDAAPADNAAGAGSKGHFKLDRLRGIERDVQQQWANEHAFELDAPAPDSERPPKFMATFPYPYMNGKLHRKSFRSEPREHTRFLHFIPRR